MAAQEVAFGVEATVAVVAVTAVVAQVAASNWTSE